MNNNTATIWERLRAWLAPAWDEVSRHFMHCNGACYEQAGVKVIFEDDDGFAMRVIDAAGVVRIYAYYCPACGRKLRRRI